MPKKVLPNVPSKPPLRDPQSGAVHPGTVEYVNADDGATLIEDAHELGASMAFVGGVPVTKIVSRALPNGARESVSYSATGKPLEVTTHVIARK